MTVLRLRRSVLRAKLAGWLASPPAMLSSLRSGTTPAREFLLEDVVHPGRSRLVAAANQPATRFVLARRSAPASVVSARRPRYYRAPPVELRGICGPGRRVTRITSRLRGIVNEAIDAHRSDAHRIAGGCADDGFDLSLESVTVCRVMGVSLIQRWPSILGGCPLVPGEPRDGEGYPDPTRARRVSFSGGVTAAYGPRNQWHQYRCARGQRSRLFPQRSGPPRRTETPLFRRRRRSSSCV